MGEDGFVKKVKVMTQEEMDILKLDFQQLNSFERCKITGKYFQLKAEKKVKELIGFKYRVQLFISIKKKICKDYLRPIPAEAVQVMRLMTKFQFLPKGFLNRKRK